MHQCTPQWRASNKIEIVSQSLTHSVSSLPPHTKNEDFPEVLGVINTSFCFLNRSRESNMQNSIDVQELTPKQSLIKHLFWGNRIPSVSFLECEQFYFFTCIVFTFDVTVLKMLEKLYIAQFNLYNLNHVPQHVRCIRITDVASVLMHL